MTRFDPRSYWEQRLEQSTGLQGVGYVGLGQSFNEWMYRVRSRVFKRVASTYAPKKGFRKVLDVGSGTGFYLEAWKSLGAEHVVGTDLTETAVERLRRSHKGIELFRMDITSGDPRLDGSFDAVSCMDVLFHVVDDDSFRAALNNFHLALKPGGRLMISDNFVHQPSSGEAHFVLRSLEQYEHALVNAGFKILDRRPMFHLLNRPMDSRSPLLWRWWSLVEFVCRKSHALGGLLAASAFPFELAFVRVRREGASTELMVCERL